MTKIELRRIFGVERPVVGMVHLLPLPGSPGWVPSRPRVSLGEVEERALTDARLLEEGGLDGLLVENFGDAPFLPGAAPAETVAALTRVAAAVVSASSVPVGVNVLRNDARGALAVALAAGGSFLRVNVHAGIMITDQGALEGRAHETLRLRASLGSEAAILADVHVKHAVPPPGQAAGDAARDLWHRAGADALIVSGAGTGRATDPARVREVRDAVPEAPLWIGSGVTPDTVGELLPLCDGMLVGSALQVGGRAGGGVDPARVGAVMSAVAKAR